MNKDKRDRVCPVERAGMLELGPRKLVHNPYKMLSPYIKAGMTALDFGCGPGFFSIEIAGMVGESGKVIAVDLQEGMLEKVRAKISDNAVLWKIIKLHQCQKDRLNLAEKIDFALLFYVLHEVPDQQELLRQIRTLLKPGGRVFIAEPRFFVPWRDFNESLESARKAGFEVIQEPKIFLSRAVVLKSV